MRTGEVVAGRFVVERVVGSGGMGSVFAAADRATGGRVALKVLDLSSDDARERFRREARVLSELSHPSVVRYVAHGETDEHVPFLAMEWLVGEDLEQRLRRGSLRVDECLSLANRIADALVFAHQRGIVHRDLKPSNLFLVDGDPARTKVLDFGIAKPMAQTHALTRSGMMIGTLGYMAPEHAFDVVNVDPRSDLFSFGCVLFEALTGRSPFAAKHVAAVFAKVLHFEPPRVSTLVNGVPRGLDSLVARLLAKNPAARPANASEVLAVLGNVEPGTAVVERPSTQPSSGSVRPSKPPSESGLSGSEQQFVSTILVELPEPPHVDRTLPSGGALAEFEGAARIISRFGGEPTRLTERGFLVVFRSGGGEAPDRAARAAACALALQESAPGAAIVVATGRADSGRALGQAVERAADLLADATLSRVVKLDAVTARLVSGHFEVARDGGLTRRRPDTGDDDADYPLLGKPMPYVGRRKDLALLCATLEEAAEERVVRRVVVTGVSGMGKTRLRREFVRRARRDLDPLVLQAAGDVVRAGSPASLAKQLVRAAMHLREADPIEIVQRRVSAHVDELVESRALAGGDVRDLTFEFLCELLDAPVASPSIAVSIARGEPGEMAERLARAFGAWLHAECRRRLVLVVLDDLQWGDAGTLHYLDRTVGELGERALMIAAFARPEALDIFPELAAHDTQRVDLSRLGQAASMQLIRTALGEGVSDKVAEQIAARAEGNAFYLEELIRHVADGGSVDHDLPETVLAMAQVRFERLEPEARTVLRAGSVFGEAFWESGITRLLGEDFTAHRVKEWLVTLLDRELLKSCRESRLAGQEEHAFRHSVVREAAYASLSSDDRRTAHGMAAAWLDESGETDPLAIAEHWERSRERFRAAPYFSRAAWLSLETQDAPSAQACTRRGLSCEPDESVRTDLLYASAMAAALAADWDTTIARSLEALPLATRGGALWSALAGGVIVGESFSGRIERSPELIVALLDPTLPLEPSPGAGLCLFTSTVGLIAFGEISMAEAALSRMAALDEGGAEPTFALYHHVTRGWWHLWVTGDLGSALEAVERARRLCANVVDRLAQVVTLHVHSNLIGSIGPAEAMRALADEVKRTRLSKQYELWLAGNALGHDVTRGAPVAYVEEHTRRFSEATSLMDRALAPYSLAQAHLVAGNYDEVERYASSLVTEPMPPYQRLARAALAFVALHRGDVDTALGHVETGLSARMGNSVVDRTLLFLARARALRAAGRHDEANEAIAGARWFVLASVSALPAAAREDCLTRIWANVRVLETAEEWLGT